MLTEDNFNENSLDNYVRTQKVKKVYRKQGEEYALVEMPYIEDWTLEKKREVAKDIASKDYISYIALDDNKVVGFIGLKKQLVGDYIILDMMHTSAEYRGKGLGRKLFELGKGAAVTKNTIKEMEEDEPCDLQMSCKV